MRCIPSDFSKFVCQVSCFYVSLFLSKSVKTHSVVFIRYNFRNTDILFNTLYVFEERFSSLRICFTVQDVCFTVLLDNMVHSQDETHLYLQQSLTDANRFNVHCLIIMLRCNTHPQLVSAQTTPHLLAGEVAGLERRHISKQSHILFYTRVWVNLTSLLLEAAS